MKNRPVTTPYAKKSLGQNFLTDQNIIRKIVGAVGLTGNDTVVEIGPGRGALTEQLLESGASVIAIELDRDLIPLLRAQFDGNANFRLREEDALKMDFREIININLQPTATAGGSDKAKLVANLPYNISTAILQRLSEQRACFSSFVLMFQREVVDRITAQSGNSERGFLTVLVEATFSIEWLFDVPPTAFRPPPKIWSSVVRITPKNSEISNESAFRELIGSAFGQKRKTILNNLKTKYPNAVEMLAAAGIDPKLRPEALTLDEWLKLASNAPKRR